jgi:hypothetical protein
MVNTSDAFLNQLLAALTVVGCEVKSDSACRNTFGSNSEYAWIMEMLQADKSVLKPVLDSSLRRVAIRELELEIAVRYPRTRSSSAPRRAYGGSNVIPSPLIHWPSSGVTPGEFDQTTLRRLLVQDGRYRTDDGLHSGVAGAPDL